MSWFTDIVSGGVDKIVDSVGNAIDKNFTSDQERLAMQNELEKIRLQAKLDAAKLEQEADVKLEEEVTKRWQSDMASDDPTAKRVRPISMVYLLIFMSFIVILDSIGGLGFDVKESYVSLIETLLMLVFAAYFGGRTLEKITNRKK